MEMKMVLKKLIAIEAHVVMINQKLYADDPDFYKNLLAEISDLVSAANAELESAQSGAEYPDEGSPDLSS